ncbi:hypothetical protein DH2020_025387 [Rehmannia glutinosa]|uniref:Uncharacterized protein n=1 Tax=Rehmannia glutinosa TaxID=99300 RepID=A0ABR0VZY8_REHGL
MGRTEDRVAAMRDKEPMSELERLQAEVREMKKRMSGQDVGEHEPLRGYVKRFNSAALDVPSATQEVLSSALSQGLQESDFFKSIAKRPAKNFDDLLASAEKYVNLEQAQKGKKDKSREKEEGQGRGAACRI